MKRTEDRERDARVQSRRRTNLDAWYCLWTQPAVASDVAARAIAQATRSAVFTRVDDKQTAVYVGVSARDILARGGATCPPQSSDY